MPSIDEAVESFERDWAKHTPPSIADYVHTIRTDSESKRSELLTELICIDMEYRWKKSQRGNQGRVLEDYYTNHPEMGEIRQAPLVLIEEEYRARTLWGDRPSHSVYVERFGERSGKVEQTLQRVEDEIRREDFGTPAVAHPHERVVC